MKLKKWMAVHGYSIPRLAKAIGVDQATVWRWMREKTCPNVKQANRIHVLTKGAVQALELETTWIGREPGKIEKKKRQARVSKQGGRVNEGSHIGGLAKSKNFVVDATKDGPDSASA